MVGSGSTGSGGDVVKVMLQRSVRLKRVVVAVYVALCITLLLAILPSFAHPRLLYKYDYGIHRSDIREEYVEVEKGCHEAHGMIIDRRGLPFPCMEYSAEFTSTLRIGDCDPGPYVTQIANGYVRKGYHKGSALYCRGAGIIPLKPLWGYLGLDTLLISIPLWLPGVVTRLLIVRHRVRNRKCLSCGYRIDPACSDVCSECGESVAYLRCV